MKVVLDANIFVSGAIQKGTPHRIVQVWPEGADFEVVVCEGILAEVRDVLLTRLRMRRWIAVETAESYIASIEAVADALPDLIDVDSIPLLLDDLWFEF